MGKLLKRERELSTLSIILLSINLLVGLASTLSIENFEFGRLYAAAITLVLFLPVTLIISIVGVWMIKKQTKTNSPNGGGQALTNYGRAGLVFFVLQPLATLVFFFSFL